MVSGRPHLVYSPGPGLWSLVLGPFGPDLGPDLGPGPELDNFMNFSELNLFFIVEYRVSKKMPILV